MLNVRYGSGCRRIVTACAARPSLCRARQRNNSLPSSGVSRGASTAFAGMRSMVVMRSPNDSFRVLRCFSGGPSGATGGPDGSAAKRGDHHSRVRKSKVRREFVVLPQPREFLRAEVVADDVREVAAAVARVE